MITFSTCWYVFKAKFEPSIYKGWIRNMLSNVNNYNLVVYCDTESYEYIEPYLSNSRIKAVIKSPKEFSTYHMKQRWMSNHRHNLLLNQRTGWELNMLWCEKLHFVQETIRNQYFVSDFYGYCDIGYFRGRSNDSLTDELTDWPSTERLRELDRSKIYYACVNNNIGYMRQLFQLINDRNEDGLPKIPIPDHQISVAGGFFLGTAENLEWWHNTFYALLNKYFDQARLIKDDQIIVVDGILSNLDRFCLCNEEDPRYDNWFLFQRYLN